MVKKNKNQIENEYSANRRKTMTGTLMSRYIIRLLLSWTLPIIIVIGIMFFIDNLGYHNLARNLPIIGGIITLLQNTLPFSLIIYVLVIFAFVTYRTLKKPLSYLDELLLASKTLNEDNDELIELPDDLKGFEIDLNEIKQSNIRNIREAKEAVQRKNDLLVYLAHDLKTPLTSVLGYLYLLKEEKEISPTLRDKYIDIAYRKSERLEDLINEFFEITRFNLTTLSLEKESINLSRMIEQICFEFNPLLEEERLKWKLNIQKDVEYIGDRNKLSRVFDNLIKNAINYSYKDSYIILSLEDKIEYCEILVTNHGKTIPKDKLNRIFDQFYRIDSSRGSSTGGSGLGLAISKDIIELHGGTIEAFSKDETVVFRIILPRD